MTHVPGSLEQAQWDRLLQLNPREPGETPGAWMARLLAVADGQPVKAEPARLPYKEPEDPEAWRDRDVEEIFGREPGSDDK